VGFEKYIVLNILRNLIRVFASFINLNLVLVFSKDAFTNVNVIALWVRGNFE